MAVADVLKREFQSFQEDATLPEILSEAVGSSQTTFPLLTPGGSLAGVIRIQDLHRALEDRGSLESVLVAADLATSIPALKESDTLENALALLNQSGTDLIPVVDEEKKLLGVVLGGDVMERYAHELQKFRLASTLAQRRSFSHRTEGIELGHGMRLAEVAVPRNCLNLTLQEAGLRRDLGVEVLYVLKGPYRVRKLASPELKLEEGDRMMVMAEVESLRRLAEAEKSQL
jgi:CBS domain-containing protein